MNLFYTNSMIFFIYLIFNSKIRGGLRIRYITWAVCTAIHIIKVKCRVNHQFRIQIILFFQFFFKCLRVFFFN